MVGKGNKNENVRSSEGRLTKYPFLLDYSIGGKKKNWFRSILYPRSIVFLLVDSMLNVNTLQIEITCTLSVDNIFFFGKREKSFGFSLFIRFCIVLPRIKLAGNTIRCYRLSR